MPGVNWTARWWSINIKKHVTASVEQGLTLPVRLDAQLNLDLHLNDFVLQTSRSIQFTYTILIIGYKSHCIVHCTLLFKGMLSHQLKQHIIDGEKTIIQNPTDQQK